MDQEQDWFAANAPKGEDWFASATPEDGVTTKLRDMGVTDDMLSELDEMDAATKKAIPSGMAAAGGFFGGPLGSGAGAGLGVLATGGSIKQAGKEAAINAAVPFGLEKVIGRLRPMASGLLQGVGKRAMKGAIKPDRGYLEKMGGSKVGGIAKMEDEIVDTAMSRNINPVRRKGMDQIQGAIDEAATAREAAINAAPNTPIAGSGRAADRAALKQLAVSKRGDAPQDDIATVLKFLDELRTSPQTSEVVKQGVSFAPTTSPVVGPTGQAITRLQAVPGKAVSAPKDLTPREAATTIEAGNDRLRGLFNGQTKNSEIQARLAVQRARTKSLDSAAGTGDASDKMRRLIDLRNVSNIAVRRAESNNPISLTDVISLSTGRPAVLAGSIGMKAPVLGELALLMNRGGKSLSGSNETAQLLRRILLGASGVPSAMVSSHEDDRR